MNRPIGGCQQRASGWAPGSEAKTDRAQLHEGFGGSSNKSSKNWDDD